MKKWLFLILMNILLLSCARVGSPVGGKKDSLAPVFVSANIDSSRTNVPTGLRELRLNFNEYITLKEISKNLVISPPITKIKRILPTSLGNKYVLIQWEDSLKANTTYNFNFGNAISDLNEGNVLPYFNFAFSTGDKLDNLYISGDITDAMSPPADPKNPAVTAPDAKNGFVVGLYKATDSVDYRQKPYYITKADPDGYFELNYLSPGSYHIIGFMDENQNSVFDAGKEAVAFMDEPLKLSGSISGLKLMAYPSAKKLRYLEAAAMPGGVTLLFEGNPLKVEVQAATEKLTDYRVTHRPKSDTVQVWFDAAKLKIGENQSENLKFSYKADTLSGKASVFYRMNPKDEFALRNSGKNLLPPHHPLVIDASYPVAAIAPGKWVLTKDSVRTPFSAKIPEDNPLKIIVDGSFNPGARMQLTIPKGSVTSYASDLQKTYQFNFEIDREDSYGSIVLNLSNAPAGNFWVELLDSSNKVQYSRYTNGNQVKFSELSPGKYRIRLLSDDNGNHFWDAADFVSRKPAEKAYFFSKTIEIRPLWENVESWNVQQETGSASVEPTPKDQAP